MYLINLFALLIYRITHSFGYLLTFFIASACVYTIAISVVPLSLQKSVFVSNETHGSWNHVMSYIETCKWKSDSSGKREVNYTLGRQNMPKRTCPVFQPVLNNTEQTDRGHSKRQLNSKENADSMQCMVGKIHFKSIASIQV